MSVELIISRVAGDPQVFEAHIKNTIRTRHIYIS